MKAQASRTIKILPVIFARADSTRLPGKVLAPILAQQSVIQHLIEQVNILVKDIGEMDAPIIATTNRVEDNVIAHFAETQGVAVYRGDLLPTSRLCEVAHTNDATWLWRLNADSPMLLFPLIKEAVAMLRNSADTLKIVTNLIHRTFPYGVSLEMFCQKWLQSLYDEELNEEELEHITPIRKKLHGSVIGDIEANDIRIPNFNPSVRLTIDEQEDADFFNSLWRNNVFNALDIGSIERVTFAYKERIKL